MGNSITSMCISFTGRWGIPLSAGNGEFQCVSVLLEDGEYHFLTLLVEKVLSYALTSEVSTKTQRGMRTQTRGNLHI